MSSSHDDICKMILELMNDCAERTLDARQALLLDTKGRRATAEVLRYLDNAISEMESAIGEYDESV